MNILFTRRAYRRTTRKVLKCVSRVLSSSRRLFLFLFFFFPFKSKRTVAMTGGHNIRRHLAPPVERSDSLIAPSDFEFPDNEEGYVLIFAEELDDELDFEDPATAQQMAGHPCARRTNLADLPTITTAIPPPTKARGGLVRFIKRDGRVVPVTDRLEDDSARRERPEEELVVVSPITVTGSLTDSAILRQLHATDAAGDGDEDWCEVGDEKEGDDADEDSLESPLLMFSKERTPSARTAVSGTGFLPSIPAISSGVSPVLDGFGVGIQNEDLPLRHSSENMRSKKTKKQTCQLSAKKSQPSS